MVNKHQQFFLFLPGPNGVSWVSGLPQLCSSGMPKSNGVTASSHKHVMQLITNSISESLRNHQLILTLRKQPCRAIHSKKCAKTPSPWKSGNVDCIYSFPSTVNWDRTWVWWYNGPWTLYLCNNWVTCYCKTACLSCWLRSGVCNLLNRLPNKIKTHNTQHTPMNQKTTWKKQYSCNNTCLMIYVTTLNK